MCFLSLCIHTFIQFPRPLWPTSHWPPAPAAAPPWPPSPALSAPSPPAVSRGTGGDQTLPLERPPRPRLVCQVGSTNWGVSVQICSSHSVFETNARHALSRSRDSFSSFALVRAVFSASSCQKKGAPSQVHTGNQRSARNATWPFHSNAFLLH